MSKKNRVILVVDDEKMLRDTLADILELEDYTVLRASGGEEALKIVRENNIDFVISDVRMPKGDGVALLDGIRALSPGVPIVLLVTGFAEITRDEVVEKGGIDLMSKPYDIDKIIQIIEDHFDS